MQDQSNAAYPGDCNAYGEARQFAPGMQQQGFTAQQVRQAAAVPPAASLPQDMMPESVANPYFLAGYLHNFIGKIVRVQFSLGTTGALTDAAGQLLEVGATYIALKQIPSNFELIADIFSVKFVTLYPLNML